jgi:hypothetical protein
MSSTPSFVEPVPDRAGLVLAASGLLGFALGGLYADWQVVVETGQVLAGLVAYPADNPFFIYHVKVWSLLNQLSAVLLRAGLSEIALSVIVSGLLGALSFQAITLVVYVLSRDAWLSIGAAFVIFLGRATDFGVAYPVALLGTPHTYGVVGLSWVVLVIALFGAGRPKPAGLLLGLAPAVHPSLGLWLGVLIGATAWLDWRRTWAAYRSGLRWFILGGCLTTISLAVHAVLMPPLPPADPEASARYLGAFVSFWDGHRGPVVFARAGVAINVALALASVVWLLRASRELSPPVTFLLRFAGVAGITSLAMAGASHLPPDLVPAALLVLMPSRLLNINVVLGAAMLLGVACHPRGILSRVGSSGIVAVVLLWPRSAFREFIEPDASWVVTNLGVAMFITLVIAGLVLLTWVIYRYGARDLRDGGLPETRLVRAQTLALMVTAAALSFLLGAERLRGEHASILKDRTNESIFTRATETPGLVLTGGDLHLIQLRIRRPVLLDGGGLDALPYTLEAAPAMARILKDVYGVDFFNPPAEARGQGSVPMEANRVTWEGYSTERWREIAATYDVTQVFTPAEWRLQLPVVAAGQGLVLYRIPR